MSPVRAMSPSTSSCVWETELAEVEPCLAWKSLTRVIVSPGSNRVKVRATPLRVAPERR